jgi:iron-sulfur cluster repair protein YtfE (RIC family)
MFFPNQLDEWNFNEIYFSHNFENDFIGGILLTNEQLSMLQSLSQGTKIFLILVISYISITQLFLYSNMNQKNQKTQSVMKDLNDFLDNGLSKLTTMTFSTATFIRNIGKHSTHHQNLIEIEKKIEKILKTHLKQNRGQQKIQTQGVVSNQLSDSEMSPTEPLKLSILINTKNLKNFEKTFRSIASTFENTGIVFRVYGLNLSFLTIFQGMSSVDEDTSFQDGRFLLIMYKDDFDSRKFDFFFFIV